MSQPNKLGFADLLKKFPLTILIVDDDIDYYKSLYRDAQGHNIALKHALNQDDMIAILEGKQGKDISGIILDVVCNISKEQQIPKSNFVQSALLYLNEKKSNIPIVVLTGEPEEYKSYKKMYEGTKAVYSKGDDPGKMFEFMREEALKLVRIQIQSKYSDIVNIVDEKLGGDAKEELLSTLSNLESEELHAIKGNLSCIRSILEKIFYALNAIDNNMIPDQYVHQKVGGRDEVDFSGIMYHLCGQFDKQVGKNTGKEYIAHQSMIERCLHMVYRGASEGIHAIKEKKLIKPSKYTVQAIAFALLDILVWFDKEFVAIKIAKGK